MLLGFRTNDSLVNGSNDKQSFSLGIEFGSETTSCGFYIVNNWLVKEIWCVYTFNGLQTVDLKLARSRAMTRTNTFKMCFPR